MCKITNAIKLRFISFILPRKCTRLIVFYCSLLSIVPVPCTLYLVPIVPTYDASNLRFRIGTPLAHFPRTDSSISHFHQTIFIRFAFPSGTLQICTVPSSTHPYRTYVGLYGFSYLQYCVYSDTLTISPNSIVFPVIFKC